MDGNGMAFNEDMSSSKHLALIKYQFRLCRGNRRPPVFHQSGKREKIQRGLTAGPSSLPAVVARE